MGEEAKEVNVLKGKVYSLECNKGGGERCSVTEAIAAHVCRKCGKEEIQHKGFQLAVTMCCSNKCVQIVF